MAKRRAMTSDDASFKKVRGHITEHDFAELIDGVVNRGNQQGKKDVIDQSDRTHSVKGGKYWQIFLYRRNRLASNTMLRGIGNLADIMIECLDAFPEAFADYQADKKSAKTALQAPMRKLREELEQPQIYAAFIQSAFFNGNEVDYLTIYSDDVFHIFPSAVVVDVCNSFSIKNSVAMNPKQMSDQKVLLKLGVNIGELEVRTDSKQHYKEMKFRINGQKFLKILQDKVGDDFEERNGMIVYGKAKRTFKSK